MNTFKKVACAAVVALSCVPSAAFAAYGYTGNISYTSPFRVNGQPSYTFTRSYYNTPDPVPNFYGGGYGGGGYGGYYPQQTQYPYYAYAYPQQTYSYYQPNNYYGYSYEPSYPQYYDSGFHPGDGAYCHPGSGGEFLGFSASGWCAY